MHPHVDPPQWHGWSDHSGFYHRHVPLNYHNYPCSNLYSPGHTTCNLKLSTCSGAKQVFKQILRCTSSTVEDSRTEAIKSRVCYDSTIIPKLSYWFAWKAIAEKLFLQFLTYVRRGQKVSIEMLSCIWWLYWNIGYHKISESFPDEYCNVEFCRPIQWRLFWEWISSVMSQITAVNPHGNDYFVESESLQTQWTA